MFKDYVAETEEEAINEAIEDLHIERTDFDVEVLETKKRSLFKKGYVKIRVYVGENKQGLGISEFQGESSFNNEDLNDVEKEAAHSAEKNATPQSDFEKSVLEFVSELLSKMGFDAKLEISEREEDKLSIAVITEEPELLIGRHGQTLDALQVIINSYFSGEKDFPYRRIVLDAENYRERREESLVKNAYFLARRVRNTKRSVLLEPMNSYDRRLVHRALDDFSGVRTESEGEGPIKTIRIIPE